MLVARSRINVALPPDFWKSCHDIVQSHCQNGRRSSSYKVYPNLWRSRQSMCRLIHSEKLHAKYSLYPGSAKVRPRNWMSYCYQGPGKIHQCNHRNEHGGPCQNHHAAILFLRDALISESESICKERGGIVTSFLEEHCCTCKCSRVSFSVCQLRIDL
jgi:hypothetical protein